MAKKIAKTNAARMLDKEEILYELLYYTVEDGKVDGVSVASKIGYPPELVYKTLVASGASKQTYVFVIPVAQELDLKKAAKSAGEKKIDMIPVKDILSLTGYVRGGCSPVGMKKPFPTFISAEAEKLSELIVSAGKIGMQIKLAPTELVSVTKGHFAELTASIQ
ncbi:Cys-tRNA(Pro) deacylase YbaK [Planococcus halocryophilus Or1]|uniref:Cys-tRNA(Pro)/Cys-tRNA(Cys) deacylase n=1 Tax=Planococcus halocryophilus TaxID=1215089 RepID=A0A1C7DS38_9BACL|nr:Cys-tRNA(Pro) deacylase [Planococcus halocryophilus]ANU14101.1 aminoacyl-tRNA deacylase [Planococcus halocryophilus]EMF47302.1 Cys-tRNA(Pro) deacylase YbaK [Planococcus halocryophilus Or1]